MKLLLLEEILDRMDAQCSYEDGLDEGLHLLHDNDYGDYSDWKVDYRNLKADYNSLVEKIENHIKRYKQ